jgi:periplasmic protein TonB
LKPKKEAEKGERRRFLIIGGVVSVGIHLGLVASGNLLMSGRVQSRAQTPPASTEVELVATAPEPKPPPPVIRRPPPKRLVAKTPKVEGVPHPQAKKEAAPVAPQPPPTETQPENSTASNEVSSGSPAAGEMTSPTPDTTGGGSGSSTGQQANPGTSGQTTTASKGNASFTSARPDYLHNPPPEYPEEARINHEQGVVILLVDVGTDGTVLKVSVARSSGYRRLDEAALRVTRDWKFKPGTVAGQPVRSQVEVPMRFKLQ